MSGFTIFAIGVLACALVGFVLQKNGELAGLGNVKGRSALRAPHGKLTRTKRLDNVEDAPFFGKFARVGAMTLGATVVIVVLGSIGVLDLNGALAMALDFVFVVGIAVGVTQFDAGIWRSMSYALFGYLFGAVLATVAGVALGGWVIVVNAASMFFGAIGASVAVSAMPPVRTYAREFEDGHVNSIQVTARSMAAQAYDELLDAGWAVPVDRVQHPNAADDPRAMMEKRAK